MALQIIRDHHRLIDELRALGRNPSDIRDKNQRRTNQGNLFVCMIFAFAYVVSVVLILNERIIAVVVPH